MTDTTPRSGQFPTRLAIIAAVVALVLVAAWLVLTSRGDSTTTGDAAPAAASSSAAGIVTNSAGAQIPGNAAARPSGADAQDNSEGEASAPGLLRWDVGTVPESWMIAAPTVGDRQWKIGTSCGLALSTERNLGVEQRPLAQDLIARAASRLSRAIKKPIGPTKASSRPFEGRGDGVPEVVSAAAVELRGGPSVQGMGYGYRDGSSALIAITWCTDGTFERTEATRINTFMAYNLIIARETAE